MSQYLNMYLEEAGEHVQKLNESLLNLEGAPDSRGILDDIFRSAHTLKGMSATMGFNRVADLTHEMEDVLHKLRNGEIHSTQPIVDALFQCIDTLDGMLKDISGGGSGERPIDHLVQSLRTCPGSADRAATPCNSCPERGDNTTGEGSSVSVEQAEPLLFNEFEKDVMIEAIDQGYQCYHLVVNISPSCIMKSARAFMVFRNMEAVGEIIKTVPSVQDIEDENFANQFQLVLLTKESKEVVIKGIVAITEVEQPDIYPVAPDDLLFEPKEVRNVRNNSPEATEEAAPQVRLNPAVLPEAAGPVPVKIRTSHTVRVDANRLDSLMNLVGELVINKTRLEQIGRNTQIADLNEALEQISRIAADLQNVVMKVRMVPIDNVFSRFPRMVRDLARELGKEVELVIQGKETELDRTVIDEIGDPLVHLLRNSVDHGIEAPAVRSAAGKSEQGRILLAAHHEGNSVIISVQDDGHGLDPELIRTKAVEKGLIRAEEAEMLDESALYRLILMPGFTTARTVTDVSGRGVGLDAVKTKIEALNGTMQIESTTGRGTRFEIRLPLTIAIIQALLVSLENEIYAIPLSFIVETTSVIAGDLKRIREQEVILLRGEVLPLVRLHDVLQVPPANLPKEEEINIVVVRKGDQKVGLIVDTLIGQQEIVIKPLGKLMGGVPFVAGATILGNGQVSLIIDVASLF